MSQKLKPPTERDKEFVELRLLVRRDELRDWKRAAKALKQDLNFWIRDTMTEISDHVD